MKQLTLRSWSDIHRRLDNLFMEFEVTNERLALLDREIKNLMSTYIGLLVERVGDAIHFCEVSPPKEMVIMVSVELTVDMSMFMVKASDVFIHLEMEAYDLYLERMVESKGLFAGMSLMCREKR